MVTMKLGPLFGKGAVLLLLTVVAPVDADAHEAERTEDGRTVVEEPTTGVEAYNTRTRVEVRAPGTDVDLG